MNNALYPWQDSVWEQLQKMRPKLPHALLIHGAAGTGKTQLAMCFAQALLCEQPRPDGKACDDCVSCHWFSNDSHLDFRLVRPDALGGSNEKSDDDGDSADDEGGSKSSKKASKNIRIDQVRDLTDFMHVSTHRKGRRVVLVYPAETLNMESSNALLKMLEEPASHTLIILVSNNQDALLPTILSRCLKFPVAIPSQTVAAEWLSAQGMKDANMWLAEQGGAPLLALAMHDSGQREELDKFLRQLLKPSVESALQTAMSWQKKPTKDLLVWLQQWLYDIFSAKHSGHVRYFPRYEKELLDLAKKTDNDKLMKILKSVTERKKIVDHPLAMRLFLEDTLLEYLDLCP